MTWNMGSRSLGPAITSYWMRSSMLIKVLVLRVPCSAKITNLKLFLPTTLIQTIKWLHLSTHWTVSFLLSPMMLTISCSPAPLEQDHSQWPLELSIQGKGKNWQAYNQADSEGNTKLSGPISSWWSLDNHWISFTLEYLMRWIINWGVEIPVPHLSPRNSSLGFSLENFAVGWQIPEPTLKAKQQFDVALGPLATSFWQLCCGNWKVRRMSFTKLNRLL